MRRIDLTGQRFNMLTVISFEGTHRKPGGQTTSMWRCMCDCGNEVVISLSELRSGGTKSCGCLRNAVKDDLSGQKFGLWTVLKRAPAKRCSYLCRCECGNERVIRADGLKTFSETSSCGCNASELLKEQYRNGRKTSAKDLTGLIFGQTTVIGNPFRKNNNIWWMCKCGCGKVFEAQGSKLTSGKTTSCGCLTKQLLSKANLIDLTGQTFGNWRVLKRGQDHVCPNGQRAPKWLCRCSCGVEREVFGVVLRNGTSRSCGCVTSSKGEQEIAKILRSENVEYVAEYSFEDLVSSLGNVLRFDFCIFDRGKIAALIEFQGEQHYYEDDRSFGYAQRTYTDPRKRQYCKDKKLVLYEIRFDDNGIERTYQILFDLNLLHDNSVPSSAHAEKV